MRTLIFLALVLSHPVRITEAEVDKTWHMYGCRTTCGLYAPLTRDCPSLQAAEDRILGAYNRHVARWSQAQMCSTLSGWSVMVSPGTDKDGVYTLYLGMEKIHVYGLTLPREHMMIVGTDVWAESALAHEMGHVFEITLDKTQGGHNLWNSKGICAAINQASALADDCGAPQYN